jgi:alanine-synthesizing transaminase
VRIGLVENPQRLRQAIRNIRAFLQADSNVADPRPADSNLAAAQ